MKREPSAASRAMDEVENVEALGRGEYDDSQKKPWRVGQDAAGDCRDKRKCPNPVWEKHSARQMACPFHVTRSWSLLSPLFIDSLGSHLARYVDLHITGLVPKQLSKAIIALDPSRVNCLAPKRCIASILVVAFP